MGQCIAAMLVGADAGNRMDMVPAMHSTLNYWMVALSLLIAIGASYAALDVAGRATAAVGRTRASWLIGGAASMGLGIWAMHYIGMLAFALPVDVFYHMPTVFLSLVAAILSSGVALVVASRARWSWPASIVASVFMGGGISAMHYIGMAAMRLPAMMQWNHAIVALSVIIAVVVSLVAMWLAFRFRSETRQISPLKIASAVVMGLAVFSMHYTGMAAATFLPSETTVNLSNAVLISALGVSAIILITLVVLVFSALTSVFDRRMSVQSTQLKASEERYRSVVDAATDVIITIDEDSIIEVANPAAERVFGYTPQELVGRDLTMLLPTRIPGRKRASIVRYLDTDEKRTEWSGMELTGLHKDGRAVPLEVSIGESRAGGRHIFAVILRDVTERHQAAEALLASEERMRYAMEAARVGTWQVDFVTGVSRWSAKLERLHGLVPGEFGETHAAFLALIHPEDASAVSEAIDTATRNRTDSNVVYRCVWPDGTTHWINRIGRTFYDGDGAPAQAAGISHDDTERRALEERFRQSQKMEAVGQLAGGVAHDFNNILTAIHGYAALLAETLPAGTQNQDDVLEIMRASESGASLTRQLLAFSRKQLLTSFVLDLAESITTLEPMLHRLIGEHIQIVVRAKPDLGHVKADPGQIEQVVLNLALNARDAMPDGGTLRIELRNAVVDESNAQVVGLPHGDYVRLSVSDTGIGMDAVTLSRVFEPFFSTKAQGKGTGLGLATVYGVVTQSGGGIQVNSEPGRGTTFHVYLPAVDAPVDRAASKKPDALPRGSETVLVVEDNDGLRKMVCRMLEQRGYTVFCAGAPQEAIEMAASAGREIDLLLSDVVLPEMSGRLLAETLGPRHPEMRVLLMSGYTDDALVRRGVLEGETHFLQKPFTQGALLQKVREALEALPV